MLEMTCGTSGQVDGLVDDLIQALTGVQGVLLGPHSSWQDVDFSTLLKTKNTVDCLVMF